MDSSGLTGGLAASIITGAYFLLFSLLLVLWNWMNRQTRDLINILEKLKGEIAVNGDRIDVHDRVSSSFTDEEFDSKAVALKYQHPPSTRKLRKLMTRENGGL